jgi:hypothetical protein
MAGREVSSWSHEAVLKPLLSTDGEPVESVIAVEFHVVEEAICFDRRPPSFVGTCQHDGKTPRPAKTSTADVSRGAPNSSMEHIIIVS